MTAVAIIPARGGSKRIPRKNIREFCGLPMIAHSIAAAAASGCFDRVIVSTDDEEIAGVARRHGAEVPFLRPAALADDYATTMDVMVHALQEVGCSEADLACCIYATAPFVDAADLRRGLERLQSSSDDYAFSVTSFPYPIQRALKLDADGHPGMFYPEHAMTRSQDLTEAFHDAGQFYWGRASAFLGRRPIFAPGSAAIVLPRHRVQDIDTLEDWERAEWMWRALKQHG
ncbi:MAG TPA: pseudaminic acid cytidylyltransferase [Solimonas sp.]|nr:pseudaminic acid cytidylyltransferase [Solimonas sp.]